MSATAEAMAPVGADAWQLEWWERGRDRRNVFAVRHAIWLRRLLIARAVFLFGSLLWLAVSAIVLPDLRSGLGVWLGVLWILTASFLLARTKTFTWSGYMRLFAVSIPWSVAAAVLCHSLGLQGPLHSLHASGPFIAIAAIGEESLKLLPIALLAMLAPGRVHRFSTADWMLAGLASGAAFEMAEEFIRRVGHVDGGSLFDFDRLSTDLATYSVQGMQQGHGYVVFWPGHHVTTAFVTAAIGISIAMMRHSSRRRGVRRHALLTAALFLPVAAWFTVVSRHAALNAEAKYSTNDLPAPMAWWDALMPDRWGNGLTIALLVVLVMLIDARRFSRWGDADLVDTKEPGSLIAAEHQISRACRGVINSWPRMAGIASIASAMSNAFVRLVRIIVRDIGQVIDVHRTSGDESWWVGAHNARSLVVMQREQRELVNHLDAPPEARRRWRLVATIAFAALIVATVVIAPAVANHIDTTIRDNGLLGWLAGLLDDFKAWFIGLSGWEKLLAGVAIAMLVFASGGTLGAALTVGSLAYNVLDKGDEAINFVEDPQGAARRYFSSATPAGVLTDMGELALTFWLPARGAPAATRQMSSLLAEYRHNPGAYRQAQRAWLHDKRNERHLAGEVERGSIRRGHLYDDGLARINGRRPINYLYAGRRYDGPKWTPDLQTKYPNGVHFTTEGFPNFTPYRRYDVALEHLTAVYREDEYAANALAGFARTPKGYVWHHVEDGKTLQLVPEDIHKAVRHTGGAAVLK